MITDLIEYGKEYSVINEMYTFPALEDGLKSYNYDSPPYKKIIFQKNSVITPFGDIDIIALRIYDTPPVTVWMKCNDNRWNDICVSRSPNGLCLMLHDDDGHITYMLK